MGALVVLFALALLVVPIAAIGVFYKLLQLQRQVREAQERLGMLDTRVDSLAKRVLAAGAAAGTAAPAAPAPPPRPPVATPVPPPPTVETATPKPPTPPPVPSPKQPPIPPPRPPVMPRPPAPPEPETPGFDWESLLGVRGAAAVGAIAFVVAAILAAKYAIDQNLITPELRIALLVASGVGCLVGAEFSLRRGYATTANAVSGAGIAILYASFYSAHALYHLIPVLPTFALMALVTVLGCVLAIRYDAFFTAVLGLLGGFATPVALSTGEDRPIGLFSYVLLLNVGLAAVALRKRWHGLVLLALVGTFLIEYGWYSKHLTPEKTLIGLLAFLVFGLMFLVLPLLREEDDGEGSQDLLRAGAVGGVAPFLFAVLIAGNPRYAGEWPLLFAFVGLLLAALSAVALFRSRTALLVSGAVATAITLPLWASANLASGNAFAATLGVLAITVIGSVPLRVGGLLGLESVTEHRRGFEIAGWIAGAGLGLYGFVLAAKNLGGSPWPFVLVAAGLLAALLERSREGGIRVLVPLGALLTAVLIQSWFFISTGQPTLLRNLSLPLLFALALSLAASRRRERDVAAVDEIGVVIAALTAIVGLFGCLGSNALGGDPLPLFAALVVAVALLLVTSLRMAWGGLTFVALLASAAFAFVWQQNYFQPQDLPLVLPIVAWLYLVFLSLPFWLPDSVSAEWKRGPWPWAASGLAGPLFFLPLHGVVVDGWGKSAIGLLPVTMAAFTVAALYGISRRFTGQITASPERLRYLALFAAVALGLIAVAIPLQLDRQWITLGWALEGMAVWWLFGKLPHPGLRLFGAVLLSAVGIRLLPNFPEVVRYQERGWPILNWLLYTYGIAAVSCLVGARFLARAERSELARKVGIQPTRVPAAFGLLGLLLIFALINLEIADYFSPGRYIELTGERSYARDLTRSVAWGLYAMTLLVVGVWRKVAELRYLSLAFLLLTVAKVFLYDLANVGGVYRILSFLGLGVSLILVSLFYQRFVFRREPAS